MQIILDSNVLISALLKDSVTRQIIVKSEHPLLIPEQVLHEIRKHEKELIKKSGNPN